MPVPPAALLLSSSSSGIVNRKEPGRNFCLVCGKGTRIFFGYSPFSPGFLKKPSSVYAGQPKIPGSYPSCPVGCLLLHLTLPVAGYGPEGYFSYPDKIPPMKYWAVSCLRNSCSGYFPCRMHRVVRHRCRLHRLLCIQPFPRRYLQHPSPRQQKQVRHSRLLPLFTRSPRSRISKIQNSSSRCRSPWNGTSRPTG